MNCSSSATTSIIRAVYLAALYCSVISCGGGDQSAYYTNESPIANNPQMPDDSTNNSPNPSDPENAADGVTEAIRGVTSQSETEHYSVSSNSTSISIDFGLLESDAGSYELEPLI